MKLSAVLALRQHILYTWYIEQNNIDIRTVLILLNLYPIQDILAKGFILVRYTS